jgi:CheY-like chemotaxis protein
MFNAPLVRETHIPKQEKMMMSRILVVEDDDSTRNLMARILQRLGYDTAEAANGQAALDLLARDAHYDLVISDVRMAPMDGLLLLAEVKNHYPAIRVLMTSVHGRPDWINSAMSSGANGFLLKPFIKDQLAEAVESILTPMNP